MNSIKKNYLYNTALQLLMIVVPLITTPYLTRVIGAEGIGTYSYHYAIASYFILFIKLGIDNYGNRAVAEHRNNPQELNKVFSELVYLQLLLGAVVSVAYLFYSGWLSTERRFAFLFFVTILATCFDINWFLYGIEKFRAVSIINAVVKVISTLLIFSFVKNQDGVFYYCLILNICTLISQIIAWPLALRMVKLIRVQPHNIIQHIRPNMILFMSLISVSIFKSMDKVMLGLLTPGKMEVGFYESSERIIHIPNILVTSLGTVMMPRITNMIASHDGGYKKHIFVSMIFSMAVACSMAFGIMGVSREFVPMYYGVGFEKCISLYLILLPCCIFMSFATVIRTQYLLPNHRDRDLLVASILGAVFNLIVNWILIPFWGSIGAAVATLVSETIVCIYQVATVRKELDLWKYVQYSILFILLGGTMFAAIYIPSLSFVHSIVLQVLIKVLFGAVIFIIGSAVILVIGRWKKDDDMRLVTDQIMAIISKVSGRKRTESW